MPGISPEDKVKEYIVCMCFIDYNLQNRQARCVVLPQPQRRWFTSVLLVAVWLPVISCCYVGACLLVYYVFMSWV